MTVRAGLEGHDFDLMTLAELFPEGDPCVVKDEEDDRYYLVSAELDACFTDGGRMVELAQQILGRLVAVARLQPEEFHDVTLTSQFDRPRADGENETLVQAGDSWRWRERASVVSVESIVVRSRFTVAAVATHPTGATVEPPEPRGPRYLRLAQAHPEVAELLRLLGASDMSWEDLYKAYEIVRESSKAGKKPRYSLDQLGYVKTEVDNFTLTVNQHRHARPQGRPQRELSLAECRHFFRDMAERWFRLLESDEG